MENFLAMWHCMVHALCKWEMYTQLNAFNTVLFTGKRDRCTPVVEPHVKSLFSWCLLRQRADRWTDQQHSIRAATSASSRAPAPVLWSTVLETEYLSLLTRLQLGVHIHVLIFCSSLVSLTACTERSACETGSLTVGQEITRPLWYLKVH
jgi:hypothetical protein